MRVPLLDLAGLHAALADQIREAIGRVFERSTFILGEEVDRFEQEFAAYCDARHCVAVNSGTSALHLALLALGVGAGDEVITVPNTYIATAEAISYTGARPVFVDVRGDTLNMDSDQIEGAITPRTKAIVPVHLFGRPADLEPILNVARRRGLAIVEDACQAHGALYKSRRVGTLGATGCFSFYPSKNLGACGEGGAVVTDDEELSRRLRILRNHGQAVKDRHEVIGFNYRLEGLQAAVLRVKLRHLEEWIEARRELARLYDWLLDGADVAVPRASGDVRHVYHLYVIRTGRRDALRQHLSNAGVETAVHYPTPIHLQPAYRPLGYRPGAFPEAEQAAIELLTLPLYPGLAAPQLRHVAKTVHQFSEAQRSGASHLQEPLGRAE